MPELPEVETIRAYIDRKTTGRRIDGLYVYMPRLLKNGTADEWKAAVTGRTITGCTRRGKYLLLHLDGPQALLIHLRMTGSLVYTGGKGEDIRYQRLLFFLDEGRLIYRDIRTLGCWWLVPAAGPTGITGYDTLGPDAIGNDFTAAYLYDQLKAHHGKVKPLLLDQTVVAGIGNIYADEALFLAHIRPSRCCDRISKKTAAALHDAIVQVLQQGLIHGGTTIRNFMTGDGSEGQNQEYLNVYGREGTPCRVCGATIKYVKLGGRGTHYCPHCQH